MVKAGGFYTSDWSCARDFFYFVQTLNFRYILAEKQSLMPQKNKKSKKSPAASVFSVRLGYVLGGALGFLLLFQMIQFYELRSKLNFIDSLQDSQTKVVEQISLSQNYLTQFATDLNQIREFLLLPSTDYDFSGLNEDLVFENDDDITTEIFDLITVLGEAEERESIYQNKKAEILEAIPRDLEGVTLSEEETLDGYEWTFTRDENEIDILNISLSYEGDIDYQMFHYKISWEEYQNTDNLFFELELFPNEIATIDILIEKTALVQSFYEEIFFPGEAFQNYLTTKNLSLSSVQIADDQRMYYELKNADDSLIATFNNQNSSVLVTIHTMEALEDNVEEFAPDVSEVDRLISWLEENLDPRTNLEIRLEERKIELSQLMEDRGFISTMEALGMTMSEVVEEEGRLYYSILNSEGEVLRNLVLDYATAELTVEMPTGEAESLSAAILNLSDTKKKLSTYLV